MTKKKHAKIPAIILIMTVVILLLSAGLIWSLVTQMTSQSSDSLILDITQSDPVIRDSYAGMETAHDPTQTIERDLPGLIGALGANEGQRQCDRFEGRYKIDVLQVNKKKDQALVARWCGSTGMRRSIMIKQQDTWHDVASKHDDSWKDSPAFDVTTDTPSCKLVNQHAIDPSVAPVCFKTARGHISYQLR